jgi:hypothetical protein
MKTNTLLCGVIEGRFYCCCQEIQEEYVNLFEVIMVDRGHLTNGKFFLNSLYFQLIEKKGKKIIFFVKIVV